MYLSFAEGLRVLSSSERRAANWSTDRTSADTPTHVVGLCRKSTSALLAVRVYIVVGNEVMTQQQRPSHFACLFESSVRFFTYFCCGKLENHSYHEFTHDSLLQGACLNETTALERTFSLLWQRWMFWTETDAAFGALLAPVLSRWTTKLPYCLWQWNKPGHNPGSSREFWQQPIYITAELRPAGARRNSVTVGSEREASWLCLCSVLEQIELHQSTARSARQCSGQFSASWLDSSSHLLLLEMFKR